MAGVGRATRMTRPVTDLQRTVAPFEVVSDYVPAGDQPQAIKEIAQLVTKEAVFPDDVVEREDAIATFPDALFAGTMVLVGEKDVQNELLRKWKLA